MFAALFSCIEFGKRQGYSSLETAQYLVAVLCIAGLVWFWMVATPEERLSPRKTVAARRGGNEKVLLECAFLYIALAATIGLIGSGAILLPDYTFVRRAQVADGVVVKASCKQHATVVYNYEVAEQTLTGHDQLSNGICSPNLVHAHVKIWYRSDRPDITRLSDPTRILRNDAAVLALAIITLPMLFVLSGWAKWKAQRIKIARPSS